MPRFFVDPEAISDGEIIIAGDDARHIARSLRMAVGDEITVCDGSGKEYLTRLVRIRDEECTARIDLVTESRAEPGCRVTLYMAYPKGDKLETVIQKSVELGASEIVPFESERCIKRPAPEKAEKQTARLERIAHEAAKQCGRAVLPIVERPISFTSLTERIPSHALVLLCYEREGANTIRHTLEALSAPPADIAVIVGSEGGFSEGEAKSLAEAGAVCVNLGPRILRCETAPDYALSVISCFLEL